MTRLLPYPSLTYTSPVASSTLPSVGFHRFAVSLLPLWTPCVPIWSKNVPVDVNFSTCVSSSPLPLIQKFPL